MAGPIKMARCWNLKPLNEKLENGRRFLPLLLLLMEKILPKEKLSIKKMLRRLQPGGG